MQCPSALNRTGEAGSAGLFNVLKRQGNVNLRSNCAFRWGGHPYLRCARTAYVAHIPARIQPCLLCWVPHPPTHPVSPPRPPYHLRHRIKQ